MITKKPQPPAERIADLELGLKIDEHALDEALQDQPELFYAVAKRLALMISQRDWAKRELKTVEAQVYLKLRRESRGDKRLANPEIEALRDRHPEVLAAHDEYLRLSHEADKWSALKESFGQRSYAINKLCDLYLGGYFGEVSVRSAGNDLKNIQADRARSEMRRMRQEKLK